MESADILNVTEIKGLKHITGVEVLKQQSNLILIDVRPEYELAKLFQLSKVEFIPYSFSDHQFLKLPKSKNIVVADAVGLRSKEVCERLISLGFKKVFNLIGGIVEWERNGLPITTDKSLILSGSCMCQLKNRKIK